MRKQWSEQHVQGAAGDLKLKKQWEETEPFWKPWFRGHAATHMIRKGRACWSAVGAKVGLLHRFILDLFAAMS